MIPLTDDELAYHRVNVLRDPRECSEEIMARVFEQAKEYNRLREGVLDILRSLSRSGGP